MGSIATGTMRAARFHGNRTIKLDEVEIPQPKDGQLTVNVEWCGICGSDLHEYLIGPINLPTKEHPHPISGAHVPLTLGHEICGRVSNPPTSSKFRDGDAVMVDPRILCRECAACKEGRGHVCKTFGYIGGSTGFGGYGEKVIVDEDMLLELPPQIPLEYAAVIEPLAVVWHAIKVSGISDWKDKSVLVLGGGPIGFALLLCLKAVGANKVIVSEPTEARRQQVEELAQNVINPMQDDVDQKCKDLTNDTGVEVVFDCAGVPAGLEAAFKSLKYEGLYVMVAVWEKPMVVPNWTLLLKHVTMKGTFIMADGDFAEVMKMMAEGKLKGYEKMVTGRIGLEEVVEKGFEELVNNKDKHIKIMVSPRRN